MGGDESGGGGWGRWGRGEDERRMGNGEAGCGGGERKGAGGKSCVLFTDVAPRVLTVISPPPRTFVVGFYRGAVCAVCVYVLYLLL